MPLLGDALYNGRSEEQDTFLPLHAATLLAAHPINGYDALRIRAPLPSSGAWRQHLPLKLVRAAEAALDDEAGGPLWVETASANGGDGRIL